MCAPSSARLRITPDRLSPRSDYVRIGYQLVATPTGATEHRPCCDVLFCDAEDGVPRQALIDTGALRTIASKSALEGVDLGDPDDHIPHLYVSRWDLRNAPVYRLDMCIVAPDSRWNDIELHDVPVVLADAEIPFVLLGASALTHLVVLIRDAEQVIHIKTRECFENTKHCRDDNF